MLKRILSHSAIYGLAPSIPKIAGIFVLPIITKYLTDVDFGIAGTIAAYTGAIAVLSTLGMNVVFTTSFFHYRTQYKWLWRQLYGFLQYWMIIFAILQSILLYFVIPEEAQENKWWIIILTNFSTVFFGATSLVAIMHYRLLQQPVPIAIRSFVSGILTIIANLVFIAYFQMGYMGWYISSFIAGCFINISYWPVVNKKWGMSPIYKFKWKTIKRALNVSIPSVPHYYSSYLLNSSSRLVMDKYGMNMGEIGRYNLAAQFGTYFELFAGAINTAVNPMTMEQIRNGREDIARKMIYSMVLIIYPATFLFSIWSKELFYLLVKNAELQSVYPISIILVMAYNYRPMYVASSNMFFYYEKTKGLLKVSAMAGVLSFVFYILAIPFWGIWGAAVVSYVFTQYMGYSGFFMKEYRERTKVHYPYMKFLLGSTLLTVAAFFIVESPWFVKIVISAILLACVIYAFSKLKIKV